VEELLDDVVDVVELVEDAAAVGRTEAICTVAAVVLDDAVVEVLLDEAVEGVDEVLADVVDDGVNGIAGVGGASRRMNKVKLTTSELKSDAVFPLLVPLLIVSTVLTVSSGSGLGAHCALAGVG
jgi:hypothetical protein